MAQIEPVSAFIFRGTPREVGPVLAALTVPTILGGVNNRIVDQGVNVINNYSSICAGKNNVVGDKASVILGGYFNKSYSVGTIIAGGFDNEIRNNSTYACIVGGKRNSIINDSLNSGTLSGRYNSIDSSEIAVIAGGASNSIIRSSESCITGGSANQITDAFGTCISGGRENSITTAQFCILGGNNNIVSNVQNAFIFGSNVRLSNTRTNLVVLGPNFVDADITSDFEMACKFRSYRFMSDLNGNNGVTMSYGANSWSSISDKNQKSAIEPLDYNQVLEKLVSSVPVQKFSYKNASQDEKYIGPFAQDWHAAFGLGTKEDAGKRIDTINPAGVSLACIHALYERVVALEAEVAKLRAENDKK